MGGASSSQELGQVAIVELPVNNSVGHPFTRLAFVPLARRYFPTPASVAELHALYCSDRVRATYKSGEPRLALDEYYASVVVADNIIQRRAELQLPPTFTPLCIYGEAQYGLEQRWEVLAYLGNLVPGPDYAGNECWLEMFKIYSGARLSADSDVALAIMRASTMLFRLVTSGNAASTPWPSSVHVNFNKDDSGVAGALCRLYRYIALHAPPNRDIDFVVEEHANAAGIPQHAITCNETTGLHAFLQTLSFDQSMRGYIRPSLLRDPDGRALASAVGFLPQLMATRDEPMIVISIRSLTNDSNFPSPANRDSRVLMGAANRLKLLHDECKARARAPRITDVNSLADRRVADILYEVLGLFVVPDEDVRDLADVIELQILMSMPAAQMHAPVVVKHSLAIQIVHRFVDNAIFAELIAGEVPKPQSPVATPVQVGASAPALTTAVLQNWDSANAFASSSATAAPKAPPTVAKREVIREACRKCPWRVAATLLYHKKSLGGAVHAALHDAVTAVIHSPQSHRGVTAASSNATSSASSPIVESLPPGSDRQRLSADELVLRLVDLKLRGLITMPFDKASGILYALTDVVPSTEGMTGAADAFRIIDDAVANAPARYNIMFEGN